MLGDALLDLAHSMRRGDSQWDRRTHPGVVRDMRQDDFAALVLRGRNSFRPRDGVMPSFRERVLDGAKRPTQSYEWDASGSCSRPVQIRLRSAPTRDRGTLLLDRLRETRFTTVKPGREVMFCDVLARCRQCEHCLRARQFQWRERARAEIARAPRTWFTTLTVRPEERFTLTSKARAVVADRGDRWEALSADEQFRLICDQLGIEVTLYLKRLRKRKAHDKVRFPQAGWKALKRGGYRYVKGPRERYGGYAATAFRYLVVYERHKDGFPHVHLLIHEKADKVPLSYDRLRDHWRHGWVVPKLVRDSKVQTEDGRRRDAAWYVSKYVSKDMATRLRASLRYGKPLRDRTASRHSVIRTDEREESMPPQDFFRATTERADAPRSMRGAAGPPAATSVEGTVDCSPQNERGGTDALMRRFAADLAAYFGPDGPRLSKVRGYRNGREHLFKGEWN